MDEDKLIKDMLKYDEGIRLKPYTDTVGKLTIGVGRNLTDRGITLDEAFYILETDIVACYQSAYKIFGVEFFKSLSFPRRAAIINMIFQLGETGFINFKGTILRLKDSDFKGAADSMLNSKWATQVPKRAERVVELIKNEKFSYPNISLPFTGFGEG